MQLFSELGSTVWHAKALILISDVHQGGGELDRARHDVDEALDLLKRADSKEAARLRAVLESNRATFTAS